jgi:hypothetical protein
MSDYGKIAACQLDLMGGRNRDRSLLKPAEKNGGHPPAFLS